MKEQLIYLDEEGETVVKLCGGNFHVTSLSPNLEDKATILLLATEIDAIHAAVFPGRPSSIHAAMHADDKPQPVERETCESCDYCDMWGETSDVAYCYVEPGEKVIYRCRPACRHYQPRKES